MTLKRSAVALGVAGGVLLLSLFVMPWYAETMDVNRCNQTGSEETLEVTGNAWGGAGFLGTLATIEILAAALAAIAVAVLALRGASVSSTVLRAVALLGLVAVLMVLLRMALNPGGDALDSYGDRINVFDSGASQQERIDALGGEACQSVAVDEVGLGWGIWIALVAAVVVAGAGLAAALSPTRSD